MAGELICRCRKRLASGFELDADLPIPLGESPVTILFGPSGAGKTTLLRVLAGLDKADSGEIRFRGETWYDSARGVHRAPQQRRAGFLFQDYALFPHLTVARNVEYGARRGKRKELLEAFGAESALGAEECSPCIHFGGSSRTHTRIGSLPKMYTSPTSDFHPVEWSEQKSDTGNAELLARYFGRDILFVPEAGKAGGYYVWTGTHWEHDKGNAAMYRMAKQITGILLVHASKQETADLRRSGQAMPSPAATQASSRT